MANVVSNVILMAWPVRSICFLKNTGAQSKFIDKWNNHRSTGIDLIQTRLWIRATDIPIIEYKVVQTGAKIRSGGVHVGSEIFLYQPPGLVDGMTKTAPADPATTWDAVHMSVDGTASRWVFEATEVVTVFFIRMLVLDGTVNAKVWTFNTCTKIRQR